jgi:hypothetical protein
MMPLVSSKIASKLTVASPGTVRARHSRTNCRDGSEPIVAE